MPWDRNAPTPRSLADSEPDGEAPKLRRQQGENRLFGTATSQDFIHDHAIATYAMYEAFGRSGYEALRKNARFLDELMTDQATGRCGYTRLDRDARADAGAPDRYAQRRR